MKKLFSIFCCLLLSASMVTQAQLLDAGSDSSESKKIPQRANLLKERNNAPQTDWYTYWLYADDSKMNTNGYKYLGALGSVKVYRYQWDSDLQIYFAFTDNSATWTSPISGATCVMPARGSYTVTDNNPSDHVIGGKNTSWDGNGTRSRYVEDGTSFYFNSATWYVEEGVDGPYIYTTNLTLRYIYNSRFYDPLGYSVAFKIGEPAVYKSVTVQSESTTKGTVSKSMKSGYVYTTNFTDWKEGSTYTITATPNSGYRFVRWEKNGSQISTTATTDVVIDGDATYTAYFESMGAPQYTITVQTATPDYCTVSGGGTYYAGTNVTISSASKNEHLYIFDQFMLEGEDEDQGEPSFNITVTGNATYTAYYRLANSGTITAATNNASYGTASASLTGSQPGGTAVTLTATPNAGYAFEQWNDGNTDKVRTVYVDGDRTYTAQFIVETASFASFSFDNPNDNIQIGKYTEPAAQCQTSFYPYGISLVELIAKNTTRTTKNYLQLYIKTNNFRTYNPVSGGSYYGPAYGTYSVSVPSEYGPVIGNCDNSIYESNYYFVYTGDVTDVVIGYKVETASHGGTCHFQGYEGSLSQRLCSFSSYGANYSNETKSGFSTFNSGTITVAEGAGGNPYITIRIGGTLVASIGAPAQPYTLAWDANGGELSGTYTAAGSVNEGTSITAPTATRTGYTFTGWSPAFTGTMPAANTTYTAQWTANTYNVSFAPNGGSGTMTNQVFTYGVAQNLKANTFTAPTATVTYNYNGATGGNETASATVTATPDGWLDENGDYLYDEGQNVINLTTVNGATIELTANWGWTEEITLPTPTKTGYEFDQWSFNMGGMDLMEDAGAEIAIEEDVEMTALWNIVTYNLTYEGLEGATNTNPDTYNVESETITLAAPGARDGYAFTGWTINGTPVTEITHGSTGDKTLTANWNKKLSAITLEDNRENSFYKTFKTTYDGATGLIVTYARQFIAGRWSTLCLPFDVNKGMFPSLNFGSRIYEFKYATGNADDGVNLYFSIAKSIEAGKGYIVNADAKLAARTSFTFSGVTMDLSADSVAELNSAAAYDKLGGTSTEGNIELVGTLRKGTLKGTTDGNTYMGLKENKIYYPNIATGSTILAYRGIFRSKKGTLNAERIRIIVDGEEKAELEVINGELQDVQETKKFIENGVLYIERNGIIYDATGRKVE